jgi:beta-lactamase regulating signal transducer with metallopeptidase domain
MLVDVVQWWNPVWWCVRSRMELELEKLADAWVVAEGRGSAREYARDLVDSVEHGMLGLPSWGGRGGLEERVEALLKARGAGAVSGGMLAMALAVVSVLVLAVVFRGPATSAPDATAVRDAEWRMAANPFPAE